MHGFIDPPEKEPAHAAFLTPTQESRAPNPAHSPADRWWDTLDLDVDQAGDGVRAAEEVLLSRLESTDFEGPDYDWVAFLLARHGLAFLLRGLRTGRLLAACARMGRPVGPASDIANEWDREELASAAVPQALALFRDKGLIKGGWKPAEQGLGPYFRNSCVRAFPNTFRSWQRRRANREVPVPDYPAEQPRHGGIDPADQIVLRLVAAEALHQISDPIDQSIVALAAEGFTYVEIAATLGAGLTSEAVRRRIAGAQRRARARRARREGPQ